MPYIETMEELVEELADMLGIYNQGLCLVGIPAAETRTIEDPQCYDHAETCDCRGCWCARLAHRIRQAVAHEALLSK